jgi:predicted Zn-dependent protease
LDEKPAKVKARAMLRMTKQLNEQLLAQLPNRSQPAVTVRCVTCHHGSAVPQTLVDHLRAAVNQAGADSAVAALKHLRDEAEFGRFDVSEWGVNEAARTLSAEGKHDAALALLKANAGFHPESTAIPAMMAEVHVARGDKPAAIEILRKLVAADPENRRAKRMLDQLEGTTPSGKP